MGSHSFRRYRWAWVHVQDTSFAEYRNPVVTEKLRTSCSTVRLLHDFRHAGTACGFHTSARRGQPSSRQPLKCQSCSGWRSCASQVPSEAFSSVATLVHSEVDDVETYQSKPHKKNNNSEQGTEEAKRRITCSQKRDNVVTDLPR